MPILRVFRCTAGPIAELNRFGLKPIAWIDLHDCKDTRPRLLLK